MVIINVIPNFNIYSYFYDCHQIGANTAKGPNKKVVKLSYVLRTVQLEAPVSLPFISVCKVKFPKRNCTEIK